MHCTNGVIKPNKLSGIFAIRLNTSLRLHAFEHFWLSLQYNVSHIWCFVPVHYKAAWMAASVHFINNLIPELVFPRGYLQQTQQLPLIATRVHFVEEAPNLINFT